VLVIARTVAHLFRQLRAQERPLAELELVRRAYDFGMPLHSGRFEVDGTPFHVHGLGVASLVAQVGAPGAVVATAVLHNAYSTGDWGDARGPGAFEGRGGRVRRAVGPEVEALLGGLRMARAADHLASAVSVGTAPGESQRWLVLIELCDVLDKWDDGRIAYGSDDRDDRRFVDRHESQLIELAARSGWPEVAAGLEVAFRRLAEDELPEGLLLGWRHSEVVAPPSFRRRLTIRVRGRARHALRRWRARPAPSPPTPGGR
jgi:hypothetical protein